MYYGEEKIQMVCVKWFYWKHHDLYRLLHHSANEGHGNRKEGGRLKAMGVQPGFPDLFLFVARNGFHGLAVEMKDKGYQSESQKEYQKLLEAQGYKYVVCRNLDQFIAIMDDYLGAPVDEDRKRLNEILDKGKD